MGKLASLDYPDHRKNKLLKALREVELIENGKLRKKTARDFLNESRNK